LWLFDWAPSVSLYLGQQKKYIMETFLCLVVVLLQACSYLTINAFFNEYDPTGFFADVLIRVF
jgi:hypothetical protein